MNIALSGAGHLNQSILNQIALFDQAFDLVANVGGQFASICSAANPVAQLSLEEVLAGKLWSELSVDVVFECGRSRDVALRHLDAGAKRVVMVNREEVRQSDRLVCLPDAEFHAALPVLMAIQEQYPLTDLHITHFKGGQVEGQIQAAQLEEQRRKIVDAKS